MSNVIPRDAVADSIVYVRAVQPDELPPEVAARVGGATLYGVHDARGVRIAVAPNRELAFAVARGNEMTPVSAH